MVLEAPVLRTRPAVWFLVKVAIRVGVEYALGAFVRNRFVAEAVADRHGTAIVEAEVRGEPGFHHVGFGRKAVKGDGGWIGIYEGTVEIRNDGTGCWHAREPHDGVDVVSESLYRIEDTYLELDLSGRGRVDLILVVDGELREKVRRNTRFRFVLTFRANSGIHHIHLGSPAGENQYKVIRQLKLFTDRCVVEVE